MIEDINKMKYPDKWRQTIDPFRLNFNNFKLQEVLGYPHAGNDVFYVRGTDKQGQEIGGFLKVERQKTADIKREVSIIKQLSWPIVPTIIDYSLEDPRYVLTKEIEGNRLSWILGDNKNMESLDYMEAYGELMARIHGLEVQSKPVKPRDFALGHDFYLENKLEDIERYLSASKIQDTKGFIHGDCHYANILWDGYRVSGLLDYELSGYGSREYDLAWALIPRPGQKFLKTEKERTLFLKSYERYHKFSQEAFNYYMVLFAMFFYRVSLVQRDEEYGGLLLEIARGIVYKN